MHFLQVDMEKLAEALQKVSEDDLLLVVQMIHDNKTQDTWTKNDVERKSSASNPSRPSGTNGPLQKVNSQLICIPYLTASSVSSGTSRKIELLVGRGSSLGFGRGGSLLDKKKRERALGLRHSASTLHWLPVRSWGVATIKENQTLRMSAAGPSFSSDGYRGNGAMLRFSSTAHGLHKRPCMYLKDFEFFNF